MTKILIRPEIQYTLECNGETIKGCKIHSVWNGMLEVITPRLGKVIMSAPETSHSMPPFFEFLREKDETDVYSGEGSVVSISPDADDVFGIARKDDGKT